MGIFSEMRYAILPLRKQTKTEEERQKRRLTPLFWQRQDLWPQKERKPRIWKLQLWQWGFIFIQQLARHLQSWVHLDVSLADRINQFRVQWPTSVPLFKAHTLWWPFWAKCCHAGLQAALPVMFNDPAGKGAQNDLIYFQKNRSTSLDLLNGK